jgi:hypothetical protein
MQMAWTRFHARPEEPVQNLHPLQMRKTAQARSAKLPMLHCKSLVGLESEAGQTASDSLLDLLLDSLLDWVMESYQRQSTVQPKLTPAQKRQPLQKYFGSRQTSI